jgi:DNA-binding MarR family transcriptional regulator
MGLDSAIQIVKTFYHEESMQPLIGALLRRAHERVRRRVLAHLAAAGFDDIRPTDFVMLQYPPPDGVSPSEFAADRGLSKQAMNHLLGEMERRGYFLRRADPRDGRGVRIYPTRRGRALAREARRAAVQIERVWRRRLGANRFRTVRRAIMEMAASDVA